MLTGVRVTFRDVNLTEVPLKSCLTAVTVVAVGHKFEQSAETYEDFSQEIISAEKKAMAGKKN